MLKVSYISLIHLYPLAPLQDWTYLWRIDEDPLRIAIQVKGSRVDQA
jgi:hypothetical protein